MTNIRMTSFTSSIAEHNLHLEESSCHVTSNNGLQFFLKQHFDAESSRFNEIQSVLEKVETYGSATEPDSRPVSTSSYLYSQCFQKDQNNNNKRNISSIIETMTISSTYSADYKTPRKLLPIIKELSIKQELSKDCYNSRKRRFSCPQFQETETLEEFEGFFKDFVMIEPISNQTEESESTTEEVGNLLNLDATIFPKNVIQFVASLQGDDPKIIMKSLVEFLEQNKDRDMFYFIKRPRSEMICSISLTDGDLSILKRLLSELLEKLEEEPISVMQKYKDAILYIQKIYTKLSNNNVSRKLPLNPSASSNKIEENDLIKISEYVDGLLKEDYLISSKEILNRTEHFLTKTLEKFTPTYETETFRFRKGIIIDYITLPKLLEKLLESSELYFCRRFITYTYDFYMTPLNLLLFFVYKYFVPEPLNLSHLELEHFKTNFMKPRKLRILKLIKFWIEERIKDFTVNPHLIFLLGAFLEAINPKPSDQTDNKFEEAFNALSTVYDNLLQPIPKRDKKHSRSVSVLDLGDLTEDELIEKEKSFSNKKTSAFTNPSFYFHFGQTEQAEPESHNEEQNENIPENNSAGQMSHRSIKNIFCLFPKPEQPVVEDGSKYKEVLKRSVEEISQQLTLIDSKEFSKVNIREMIVKRWSKKDKSQCPTYYEYVSRFNGFSHWLQYIILSNKNAKERVEIVKKFLDVAVFCLKRFHNYCTAHYIFSAIVSLQSFRVISLEGPYKEKYKKLSNIFSNHENYVADYEKVFRNKTQAAVPSLTTFLRIFLRLQEGVVFQVRLPDSQNSFLKFPTLVQIQDYCNEMRKFQKHSFEEVIEKDEKLYKYLKREFRKEVPMNLEDQQDVMKTLTSMVNEIKHNRFKSLFQFESKKEKG